MEQLGELQALLSAKGSGDAPVVLTVSIDTAAESERLAREIAAASGRDFNLFMLEDQGHRVIDRYGLLNPNSPGWPHPATYVIDKAGLIRWRFVEMDYTVRASNEEILAALAALKETRKK